MIKKKARNNDEKDTELFQTQKDRKIRVSTKVNLNNNHEIKTEDKKQMNTVKKENK